MDGEREPLASAGHGARGKPEMGMSDSWQLDRNIYKVFVAQFRLHELRAAHY